MSAKRTSWNEFSSTMASAVICLSTGRKFNFSKYIFDSLVRNVDSNSKFYMYPRFIQLIIQNQLGDLSTHTKKYISPALTQKVFANMRRVGKGYSGVETPLFEGMLVAGEPEEQDDEDEQVQGNDNDAAQKTDIVVTGDDVAQDLEITNLKTRVKKLERANKVKALKLMRLKKVGTSQRIESSDDTIIEDVSNQGRMIDELDRDEGVALMGEKEEEKKVEEVKVIAVSSANTIILAAEPKIHVATITAASVKVAIASTRRRRGVVIRDPEEESTAKVPNETKSKDKRKGIMVEEPKPMKKKKQVEMDEAYARKLHEKLNQDIDWDVVVDHVKQKAKEDPYVQRYQVMKKRPQTEAQAQRNMIMYLKNTVGFRLDYFKGIGYSTC
nr:hypothetical protein [Tanacetum cinerariifolium]